MIVWTGHHLEEPSTDAAAMLRLWLRRRRLLLASVALTVVLVPSLLVMVNINGPYVIGAADYDAYDYDAVDGMRALVHQMSPNKGKRDIIGIRFLRSPEHIRTQGARHRYDEGDRDAEEAFPHTGSIKGRRGGSRKGIFRRKIQDSEDVPPEEVKGYAFLHQRSPVTAKSQDVSDNGGKLKEAVADDEMYHASEDEDDYGVGDAEEDPKDAMFEPQQDDEKDQDYLEEDEDAYDYWSRNPEFKTGDFDAMPNKSKHESVVLKYEELSTSDKQPQRLRAAKGRLSRGGSEGSRAGLPANVHKKESNLESSVNFNSKLRFAPNCDPRLGCKPASINRDRTRNMKPLRRDQSGVFSQQQQQRQPLPPRRLQHAASRSGRSREAAVINSKRRSSANSSLDVGLMSSLDDKTKVEYAHHLPLHEQPATQLQVPELPPQQGEVASRAGFMVVRNKIHWSEAVERFVSPGITSDDVEAFRQKVARLQVAEMREPQWNRCGRPKNQYVVLEDGSALCARYRAPHTKMIQGEILSFYLARLLGLDSVPVSVLAQVNSSAPQWRKVEPARAGWEDGQLVVFIQWIEGLDQVWSQVKMPTLILSAYQKGVAVDRNHPALPTMSGSELSELLQWSDMILFDYIIGHYDRVASMQDGAEREQKASIMSESIRNLRKVPTTNKLWFVDNESGLFDGYELMKYGRKNGPRFVHFHEQMLRTVCVFRRSLVENIEQLARSADPQEVLTRFTATQDPLYQKLPSVSKIKYFKQFFHTRLKEVVAWVEKCRAS